MFIKLSMQMQQPLYFPGFALPDSITYANNAQFSQFVPCCSELMTPI